MGLEGLALIQARMLVLVQDVEAQNKRNRIPTVLS